MPRAVTGITISGGRWRLRYAGPMDEFLDWVRERWGLLLLGLLALLLGLHWLQGRPVSHPPGILAASDPEQDPADGQTAWDHRGYRLVPLARFHIRARILHTERYRFDRPADLSPVDFALGWGPMSDSRVLEAITIQQRDRWYFWSASALPLPMDEITTHSANMHLIPANDGVARRLLAARTGQLADLSGFLVRAEGKDGWRWVSSLTRADTGDGSCEVVWVAAARITDR